VPVAINRDQLNEAMEKTRDIYDLADAPEAKADCKDCKALTEINNILKWWEPK